MNPIKKIKLFYLSDNWYPSIGGLENSIHLLSSNLKNYFTVEILTHEGKQPFVFENDIQVLCFNFDKTGSYYDNVFNYIREQKQDYCIILHIFGLSYFWTELQSKFISRIKTELNIPILLKIPTSGHVTSYLENDFKISKFHIDKFIALTASIAEELVKKNIPNDNIEIIPNGVCEKRFRENKNELKHINIINSNRVILGFSGRFTQQKNLKFLIDAVNEIPEETRPILLLKGNYDNTYDNGFSINEYLNNYIKHIPASLDIGNFYNELDVYISASLAEGMPNSVLEAMSSSLPVILSNISGHQELVNNNGWLFELKANYQLIDILNSLTTLKKNHLLWDLGKKSREIIENHFSINKITNLYINIYNKIIKNYYR